MTYVSDLLNGYDILSPGSATTLTTWLEEKAKCRLRKCIAFLEVGLIAAGTNLAEETKNLLAEANALHKSSILASDMLHYTTSSNKKLIYTIDICIRLLEEPEKNLSMVILIFKGKMYIHSAL